MIAFGIFLLILLITTVFGEYIYTKYDSKRKEVQLVSQQNALIQAELNSRLNEYKLLTEESGKKLSTCSTNLGNKKLELQKLSAMLAGSNAQLSKCKTELIKKSNNLSSYKSALTIANKKLEEANKLLVKNFNYTDKEFVKLLMQVKDGLIAIGEEKLAFIRTQYSDNLVRSLERIENDLDRASKEICNYDKDILERDIARLFPSEMKLFSTDMVEKIRDDGSKYTVTVLKLNKNSKYYSIIHKIESLISYTLANKYCKDGKLDIDAVKDAANSIKVYLNDPNMSMKYSRGILDLISGGFFSMLPGFVKK